MDSKRLFNDRFKAHIKEVVRYFQYILNGHIAIALLFLIGAGAVFYQQLLAQLPKGFPTAWIVSLLFASVALYNPIQNLLKKADLIFLFPAEKRLTRYFNYTLGYSFLMQLYLVALIAAALAPLYQASPLSQSYRSLVLLMLFFKVWHFLLNWWMLSVRDKGLHRAEKTIRFILQVALFYSFINGYLLAASLVAIGLFGFIFYLYQYSHRFALAWDQLIDQDQQRMQSFYRLASMFTDVPHFRATIKKRRLLVSWLTRRIPFKQTATYHFLYWITFIRSADYLGLYLRLTVIASLLLAYFDQLILILSTTLLFLFVTGIQLIPLWYHHRTHVWQELYPVKVADRKQAIFTLIRQLLTGQLIVFALVVALTSTVWHFLFVLLLGSLFIGGFNQWYVAKKIN